MKLDSVKEIFVGPRRIWAAAGAVALLLGIVLLWPEPDLHEEHTDHGGHADHADHAMPGSAMPGSAMQSPAVVPDRNGPFAPQKELWSCSMHPNIQRDEPGQCPICGMALIPVPQSSATDMDSVPELSVSPAQAALMRIETVPVERRLPIAEIRLSGKLAFDETRLAYITAWVPGRIDRLFVDYTGMSVHEGDRMVTLYSPELLSAQEELLQSIKGLDALQKSPSESLRRAALGTVASARDRLRLWGLSATQINEIEQSGEVLEEVAINSPASGVVIDRNAQEGMYVEEGTRIFTIADLDALWLQLDAYESDLSWLRDGQSVTFTTEAYPGERFNGVIAFIDPVLNPNTRTVKVRVNVDNASGRLKPEMFVRATVEAQLARDGQVLDDAQAPLLIPASAALLTGARAVVYVQLPNRDRPSYEGREVVLGPRAGDDYVVVSGLAEDELVVVSGNFKIDSALQIQARPSMMNPDGGKSPMAHDHAGH